MFLIQAGHFHKLRPFGKIVRKSNYETCIPPEVEPASAAYWYQSKGYEISSGTWYWGSARGLTMTAPSCSSYWGSRATTTVGGEGGRFCWTCSLRCLTILDEHSAPVWIRTEASEAMRQSSYLNSWRHSTCCLGQAGRSKSFVSLEKWTHSQKVLSSYTLSVHAGNNVAVTGKKLLHGYQSWLR
jgi:hypothetical protein